MESGRGVARECGGAGRTWRHLLGAANGRKLFFLIHVKIQIVILYIMCLRAIKTKHYSCSAYLSFLSIMVYNIGSLAASGLTLLVLRRIFAFKNKSIELVY